MSILGLIIGGLAVWRLSHAIVKENGPLMVFARLRARWARRQEHSGGLFDMVSCVSCTSMIIAAVAALEPAGTFFQWVGYTLALSAVASLLELLYTKNSNSLSIVTGPTRNDKIPVSRSAPSK